MTHSDKNTKPFADLVKKARKDSPRLPQVKNTLYQPSKKNDRKD